MLMVRGFVHLLAVLTSQPLHRLRLSTPSLALATASSHAEPRSNSQGPPLADTIACIVTDGVRGFGDVMPVVARCALDALGNARKVIHLRATLSTACTAQQPLCLSLHQMVWSAACMAQQLPCMCLLQMVLSAARLLLQPLCLRLHRMMLSAACTAQQPLCLSSHRKALSVVSMLKHPLRLSSRRMVLPADCTAQQPLCLSLNQIVLAAAYMAR